MGTTTIYQVFKMGIMEEVLTDFLNDLRSLSESTDNECAKQLSKEETEKYAKEFPSEYEAMQKWEIRRVNAENFLKNLRNQAMKKRVHKRVNNIKKELEKAKQVFIQKVNEAMEGGN